MASPRQLAYYWGVLLPAICDELGIKKEHAKEACDELHQAFKEYFNLKSIGALDTHKSESVFGAIRMIMARERGMLLPMPHDPPVKILRIMPMQMFLNLYKDDKEINKGNYPRKVR
ncbi:MAG: hypothetical protein WC389_16600 [Lutibacter sp.]|jgi:hypothetical protein